MSICGIYKIKNKINDMFYIGSSTNIERRWKEHKRELKYKNHHNKPLQEDWHTYGEESFEFEVVEIVENPDMLIEREQYFMDSTKCYDPKIGYNSCPKAGNCLGVRRTEKEKAWLSKVNSGERSCQAKITEKDAIDICKRIVSGEPSKSIAKDYTPSIVSAIRSGTTWRDVSIKYIKSFPKKIKKTDDEKKAQAKTRKEQKDIATSEQIVGLYLQFIENTTNLLSVTKKDIEKVIQEFKEAEINDNKIEIIKREIDINERKKKNPYLFSGIIKCLDCKSNYRGKMYAKEPVYVCSGRHNKKSNCGCFSIKEKEILEAISLHLKSKTIDLNFVESIGVKDKNIKITYLDGSYSVLPPRIK